MTESIKTILWDLDGTMLDSFGILKDILGEIVPVHGLSLPADAEMRTHFHGSLVESIANIVRLEVDNETVGQILSEFLHVQNDHYDVIEDHLLDDAVRLARKAHKLGLTQIVVSNRDHLNRLNASPRSIVQRSELKHYMSHVISGDDSEHRKPLPAVLGKLLTDGTVVPNETLVIGDQFVDALFAKNIDARAIIVNREGSELAHLEKLGDDWQSFAQIVSTLDEVSLPGSRL